MYTLKFDVGVQVNIEETNHEKSLELTYNVSAVPALIDSVSVE